MLVLLQEVISATLNKIPAGIVNDHDALWERYFRGIWEQAFPQFLDQSSRSSGLSSFMSRSGLAIIGVWKPVSFFKRITLKLVSGFRTSMHRGRAAVFSQHRAAKQSRGDPQSDLSLLGGAEGLCTPTRL